MKLPFQIRWVVVVLAFFAFADGAHAAQVKFIDQNVTWPDGNVARLGPTNLMSPNNFTEGSMYIRYEVTQKPTDFPVQGNVCIWQDNNAREACSGKVAPVYTAPGVYYAVGTPPRDWHVTLGRQEIDHSREYKRMRSLIRRTTSPPLWLDTCSGDHCVGPSAAPHIPIKFKLEVYLTTAGHVFEKPAGWSDCPSTVCGGAPGAVATPIITPNGGSFATSQSVSIATETGGASIRYTTDGSDPTASSMLYANPFSLTNSATVKAKAVKTGMSDSSITSAVFTKTASATSSCLKYPSNAMAPNGYGASWDVFSPAKELLIQSSCPPSGTSITVTVGKGDTAQYIWHEAYSYQGGWVRHVLSGTQTSGWIAGSGTASLTAPANTSATNPFYFVGYVCTNRGAEGWKCGCDTVACTTGKWQVQGYTGL